MRLRGEHIYLRALEPEDLALLYQLENNTQVWEISNTLAPYSKYVLKQYLDNSLKDIYEAKQLRLVICEINNDLPIGFIDIFDFDPKHRRAGLGIIIFSEAFKRKGFASQAINLVCEYGFNHLNLHQFFAHITSDNLESIALFEKLGFVKAGTKKDWIATQDLFKDEFIYQFIHEQ